MLSQKINPIHERDELSRVTAGLEISWNVQDKAANDKTIRAGNMGINHDYMGNVCYDVSNIYHIQDRLKSKYRYTKTNIETIKAVFGLAQYYPMWAVVMDANKCPYNPKKPSRRARVNDPDTLGTLDDCEKAFRKGTGLLGIVLNQDFLRYAVLDFDKCLTDGGKLREDLDEKVKLLIEWCLETTWCEISVSGKGVHAFFKLDYEEGESLRAIKVPGIEFYQDKRFVILTGRHVGMAHRIEHVKYRELQDRVLDALPDDAKWSVADTVKLAKKVLRDDDENIKIPEGARHNVMVSIAGHVVNMGIRSYDAILAILEIINKERCEPPLPHRELQGIAKWAASPEREMSIPKELRATPSDTGDKALWAAVTEAILSEGLVLDELRYNKRDQIVPDADNVAIFCSGAVGFNNPDFAILKKFRFNEATQTVEVDGRPIEQSDLLDIQMLFTRATESDAVVPLNRVQHGVERWAARCRAYDPVKEFFDSLPVWDGVDRLDEKTLMEKLNLKDEFSTKIFKKWLLKAVKRGLVPGCDYEMVLVLFGKQGSGKTSMLNILGGEFYLDLASGVAHSGERRDVYMMIAGKLIVELSEGLTLKRSDIAAIKQFLTATEDTFRRPYAASTTTIKRRCVFAITTNEAAALGDATGARRFYVAYMGDGCIDHQWLIENRLQIWAQALHMFKEGVEIELDRDELERRRDAATAEHPHEEALMMYLEANASDGNRDPETGWMIGVLTENLLYDALEIPQDRRSQVHTRELATLMDKLGYERCQFQKRVGGKKILRRGFIMKRFADDWSLRSKITSVLLG